MADKNGNLTKKGVFFMSMKRKKPIMYKSFEDFPEGHITAQMIANSFLRISAEYVRAGIKNGQYKGYQAGRSCYMTREHVKQNWG